MKKLLVIATVMAAVAANAASFSWKTTISGKIYEADSKSLLGSATAYLFDAGKLSQNDVLTAFSKGTAVSTLAFADKTSVANGAISTKDFDVPTGYSEGDAFNAYIAIVVDDNIYIGNVYSVETPETGTKAISMNEASTSQAAARNLSGGYSSAGWYSTASVPEPTSGLLMLIGMAGLALRRRRV